LFFSQNNKDKTIWLDIKYNYFTFFDDKLKRKMKRKNLLLTLDDTKIIHFAGDTKPWVIGNDDAEKHWHQYYNEWFKCLKISPLRDQYDYYASKKINNIRCIINIGFFSIKEIERLGIIKTKYYLLNFLPIFEVKKKGNISKSYYLIGLRIFKSKS
jgi:lipopolysaccharide biosynthesis glycosyltransferase